MMLHKYNAGNLILCKDEDAVNNRYTLWLQSVDGMTDMHRVANLLSMAGSKPYLDKTYLRDGRGEWGIASAFNCDGWEKKVTVYPIGTNIYRIDGVEISIPLEYVDSSEMKRFLGWLLNPAAKIKLLEPEIQSNNMIVNLIPVLDKIDETPAICSDSEE